MYKFIYMCNHYRTDNYDPAKSRKTHLKEKSKASSPICYIPPKTANQCWRWYCTSGFSGWASFRQITLTPWTGTMKSRLKREGFVSATWRNCSTTLLTVWTCGFYFVNICYKWPAPGDVREPLFRTVYQCLSTINGKALASEPRQDTFNCQPMWFYPVCLSCRGITASFKMRKIWNFCDGLSTLQKRLFAWSQFPVDSHMFLKNI